MPNSPAKSEATNAEDDKKRSKGDGKGPSSTNDESRFTSLDTFENPAEKFLANTQTVVDGLGVERIVSPNATGFTPAPLEATDEQKEAMERFNAMFSSASKTRQNQLTAEIKDEDRAPNNQADAGSQTSPAS